MSLLASILPVSVRASTAFGVTGRGTSFVALALFVYAVGMIFVRIYRSHGYLYQWKDKDSFVDNWVDYLLPIVDRLRLPAYRRHIAQCLAQAGWRVDWKDSHFMAFVLINALASFLSSFILLSLFAGQNPLLAVVVALLVVGFIHLRLFDQARGRLRSIGRDLPFFIDYLALAMLAGMGFNQALDRVLENVTKSPLVDEFTLIKKGISLGMTREKALYQFKDRISQPQITQFVETIVQAMEHGTGVAETLQSISKSLNTKRFQKSEEEAGKISVKMMIPVIVFILPALMLILLGPIVLEFTRI